MNWLHQDPLTIATGILAILLGSGAWLLKEKKHVLIVAALGSLCWSVHFLLIGAVTAGVVNIFITARTALASHATTTRHKHLIFYMFAFIFIISGYYSWVGLISILPVVAAIWSTFCYAYLSNRNMRLGVFGSSFLWIAQSAYYGSWENILAEILRSSATLIGLYRIRKV